MKILKFLGIQPTYIQRKFGQTCYQNIPVSAQGHIKVETDDITIGYFKTHSLSRKSQKCEYRSMIHLKQVKINNPNAVFVIPPKK